ncbi:MAG: 3-deoxy-7-phosphoheptulonate synthase [Planctomycetes bacterium]|nr:3-deoxy-7-phosphoheptulonate synthase [Planctomycetota bacterium]
MILHFEKGTANDEVQSVRDRLECEGIRTLLSTETARPIVGVIDQVPEDLQAELRGDRRIESIHICRGDRRMVERSYREMPLTVKVGKVEIGPGKCVVMAGPCSVEGREIMLEAARLAKDAGAHVLRGGAYKPRTSPYTFQGFGVEGLAQLKESGEHFDMPVVTEIMDASHLPAFVDHEIDMLQVGARNMQNFTMLKAIASAGIPVLLKRALSGTVDEWLYSAEYLSAFGCPQVVLCERGIRTYEKATRNTLDLTVLPLLREWTHLPIIVDPAHAVGVARFIRPLAAASVAAGADGLIVEAHPRPEEARSDRDQALLPNELAAIVADARVQAAVTGRQFHA